MKNAIVAAVVFSSFATSAFALDANTAIPVEPSAIPMPVNANIVPENLLQQFKAVCESKAVKSKALQKACDTQTPPAATKKGDRFKAAKGGAEVNILYSNLELINN